MPHSGGGGSHSGGGHHGGSHHSGGSGSSGRSSVRVSGTPFAGAHAYAIYDNVGHSRLVYSDSANYHAEVTKKDITANVVFGSIFMLPGIIEFVILILLFISFFHTGVKKTEIPGYAETEIVISDNLDYISEADEEKLADALEEFRDKTGIIPAIEFTDETWKMDYVDLESYAYNQYVCNIYDENHLLIVYSFGDNNAETDFSEFTWETMWGDDLGKTAGTQDEDYFADRMQVNLTRSNNEDVAEAIIKSFDELYTRINTPGFRFEKEKLFSALFLVIHGGIFFAVGYGIIRASLKKYKKSAALGEKTYKIDGEPQIMRCNYCGTTYYWGTIGNCNNCGAPLV